MGAIPPAVLELGALRVDIVAQHATVHCISLPLTPKEFALLATLARDQRRVLLNRVLLAGIWGAEPARIETLRTLVNQLRRKLLTAPIPGVRIRNEPGVGYQLLATDHAESATTA